MNTEESDTIGEVARLVGVARTTIQSAISRGEIPTERMTGGRTVVVSVEEVRRWLSDPERRPGPKVKAGSTVSIATAEPPAPPTSAGGYDPKTGSY